MFSTIAQSFSLIGPATSESLSRKRAQPTTFRIQISFLLLVTGHALGILVYNDYFKAWPA